MQRPNSCRLITSNINTTTEISKMMKTQCCKKKNKSYYFITPSLNVFKSCWNILWDLQSILDKWRVTHPSNKWSKLYFFLKRWLIQVYSMIKFRKERKNIHLLLTKGAQHSIIVSILKLILHKDCVRFFISKYN